MLERLGTYNIEALLFLILGMDWIFFIDLWRLFSIGIGWVWRTLRGCAPSLCPCCRLDMSTINHFAIAKSIFFLRMFHKAVLRS